MPFESIIGHERQISLLRKMLRSGIIPHAFIFYGVPGIGKYTTARAFAKALHCTLQKDDFCEVCTSCQKIERKTHPDVLFLEPLEDKKTITIAQLRDMQEQIAYRPFEGRWKIVIIDDADRLQPESANCLLKTLEEPPDHTVLILIATSTTALLPTVLSRCQHVRFSPLAQAEMVMYLCKNRGTTQQDAACVASYAQGSIGRALLLLDEDFLKQRTQLIPLLISGTAQQATESLSFAKKHANENPLDSYAFEFLRCWYRDILLLKSGITDTELLYNRDIVASLQKAAVHETYTGLIKKIARIHQVQQGAALNFNVQLALESILLAP